MHKALSAIQNNGVSAFQREVSTGRIGPIIGTLESVCIIEVSAFQGCPQDRIPLYKMQNDWYKWNRTISTVYVYAYCMQTVPRTQNIEQKLSPVAQTDVRRIYVYGQGCRTTDQCGARSGLPQLYAYGTNWLMQYYQTLPQWVWHVGLHKHNLCNIAT